MLRASTLYKAGRRKLAIGILTLEGFREVNRPGMKPGCVLSTEYIFRKKIKVLRRANFKMLSQLGKFAFLGC